MIHNFHVGLTWDQVGAAFLIGSSSDSAGEAHGRIPLPALKGLYDAQMELFARRNEATRAEGERLGTNLFGALMGEAIRKGFRDATAQAWKKGHSLRLVLEISADLPSSENWVHGICWELMFDRDRDCFLAIDPEVLLVRYLRQPRPVGGTISTRPVRILATSSSPAGCEPLKLDEELAQLEELFQWPAMRGSANGRLVSKVTFNELHAWLAEAEDREQPYHVWHHCGHGRFDEKSKDYQLAFEPGTPRTSFAGPWIGARQLIELLGGCRHLHLVFLNVCLAADPNGLGTLLAGLGVPAVIGYSVAVEDRIALKFSREFWRAFATKPIDEAVQRARQLLAGSHNTLAFAQAVLFLRARDPLSL